MLFVKENYKECNPVEVEEEKKTKGRMVTKLSKSRDKTAWASKMDYKEGA